MSWKTKYCEALALMLPKYVNSLGAEDSYFCCTPTLIAWLEEEI